MSQLKKGAILSYINIALTNVVGLVLTPFIVKNLGSTEYGLYVLIGSLIAYFSLLDFGIGDTVIRYISRYRVNKTKKDEAVFLGSLLSVFVPLIVFILIIGIIAYFNLDQIFGRNFSLSEMVLLKQLFLVLLFNLSFSLLGNVFLGYINAYEKFVFSRSIAILKYLLRAAAILIVLVGGGKALSIVIVDTIINVLFFSSILFYCIRYLHISFIFGKVDKAFLKEIFSFSFWLFLIALISSFQWQGGQLLLGIVSTPEKIAVYGIGVMLGTYYGAFAAAITTMFLPHASRMVVQQASEILMTNAMIKIGRITSYMLMLILTGFIIFGKAFITLWVGPQYIDAYYIAVIIMLVYTFPLVQSYANSILEAKQLMKFKGLTYITFIFLGTVLAYFGYIYYGIIGVISSICTGWLVAFLLMNRFYVKKLNLQISRFYKEVFGHQIFFLILIFSAGVLLFNHLIDIRGWLTLTLCAISYVLVFSLFYYFFVLNDNEKELLNLGR